MATETPILAMEWFLDRQPGYLAANCNRRSRQPVPPRLSRCRGHDAARSNRDHRDASRQGLPRSSAAPAPCPEKSARRRASRPDGVRRCAHRRRPGKWWQSPTRVPGNSLGRRSGRMDCAKVPWNLAAIAQAAYRGCQGIHPVRSRSKETRHMFFGSHIPKDGTWRRQVAPRRCNPVDQRWRGKIHACRCNHRGHIRMAKECMQAPA